jgi:predicted membrane protein
VRRRNVKARGASAPEPHAVERLAWYAGLTLMALFEVIEWPIAVVIAVGHEISHRARSRAIRQLAEGIEAGG